jgi:hypothetical protein
MNCFKYNTNTIEINNNMSKIKLNFYKILFRQKVCYFIEATDKINPVEYIDEIYEMIKNILTDSYVYLDLSNIYGIDNSSWLVRWEFVVGQQGTIEDEKLYRLKDINCFDKEEYIIIKDYLLNKQEQYSFID